MAMRAMPKLISATIVCVCACFVLAQEQSESENAEDSQESVKKKNVEGVSIDRIRELSSATFELLDGNSDGSVTLEELLNNPEDLNRNDARRRLNAIRVGFPSTRTRIDVFAASDRDSDGLLSRTEYEERARSVRIRSLELAFQAIDADEDGNVDVSEFNARVDRLAEWDKNADGILGRSEVDRDFWRKAHRVPGFTQWVASSRWGPRMRSWRNRR